MSSADIERVSLEAVVSFVEVLFDQQLPKGVLFDEPGERRLIRQHQYFYKGLRMWFDHLILKQRLAPEAYLTDWKYYQPHAQIHAAQLELMTGVHDCSPVAASYFDSPVHMWGSMLVHQCQQTIRVSGLLGGNPIVCGKAELIGHNLARTVLYDNRDLTAIKSAETEGKPFTRLYWHENPEDYLTVTASDIARLDPDFDAQYWIPYRKSVNMWQRKMRDCKRLQAGYVLPNGELFQTQKGRKTPKKSKGFQP